MHWQTFSASGGSMQDVPSLCTSSSSGPIHSKPAQQIHLDTLPFVDYGLVNYASYTETSGFFGFRNGVAFPLETSRGCPFQCSFCTEPAMNRGWRAQSPARVIGELTAMVSNFGARSIAFVDDLFFTSRPRSLEIIDRLISHGVDIEWYGNVRAEYVVRDGVEFFQKGQEGWLPKSHVGCRGGGGQRSATPRA